MLPEQFRYLYNAKRKAGSRLQQTSIRFLFPSTLLYLRERQERRGILKLLSNIIISVTYENFASPSHVREEYWTLAVELLF